jgi:hypothetical protein
MVVCIAGMHRSGTSMVTKMLHSAGLYLGPEADLMPSGTERRERHWEHRRFVKINAALLARLYGAWDCPPPLPIAWQSPRLAALRGRAEALVAAFAGREPWGWKDPRNCLTLPFWQTILGPIPTVIIVRHPLEVAMSLRERNGFSYALGLALWQAYNERLLAAAAAGPRLVTHYDRYFPDPAGELGRLLAFVGLAVDDERIATVGAVQTADLRHHRLSTRDLHMADVAPEIVDLYSRLCAEANWQDEQVEPADAAAAAALREAMLRSGEDPDAPAATRRTQRKAARHDRARRRTVATETRLEEWEGAVERESQVP